MKKIKIVFLLAAGCLAIAGNYCAAQDFTLIQATSQRWAGGVVGNYGINYHIEIETKSKVIRPDTVWINGKVYPIDFSVNDGTKYRTLDSVNHKIKYSLLLSDFHSGFHPPGQPKQDSAAHTPKPVRQFDGEAMISYMRKHKQYFFIIHSLTRLKQLNYP